MSDDLVNGKVELVPGIVIDDRFKVGGVMYLESKFGKPLTEIFEDMTTGQPKISDMVTMFKALYRQANKGATDEKIDEVFDDIELDQITGTFAKLKLFELSEKNSPGPGQPTPAAEQ